MTRKLFTRGRVSCILLIIALLLLMIPLLSFRTEAAIPKPTTSAVYGSDWWMDFTGQYWYYGEDYFYNYYFPSNDYEDPHGYWEWYGSAQNGYEANTLVLKEGFELDSSYGIKVPDGTTVVVNENVKITSSGNECILSNGGLAIQFSGSGKAEFVSGAASSVNSADDLTITTDGDGRGQLYTNACLSAADIDIDSVDIVSEYDSAVAGGSLISGSSSVSLNDCSVKAGNQWAGTDLMTTNSMKIKRNVALDLPDSFLVYYSADIAFIDSAENMGCGSNTLYVLDRGAWKLGLRGSLRAVNAGKRMKLVTKPLTVSNYSLYDDEFSDPDNGEYFLLGGRTYRIPLSDITGDLYYDLSYEISPDSSSVYSAGDFNIKPLAGYIDVTVPNQPSAACGLEILIRDDTATGCSGETRTANLKLGEILGTNKLNVEYAGSAASSTDTCVLSVSSGDTVLVADKDAAGKISYFLPAGDDAIGFELFPGNGYMIKSLKLDGSELPLSVDGSYSLGQTGDHTLTIETAPSSVKQYLTVDVSNELHSAFNAGDVTDVTAAAGSKTISLADGEFPCVILSGTELNVTVASADKTVTGICGKSPVKNGSEYSAAVTVSDDMTITAILTRMYSLEVVSGEHGTVTPGTASYAEGTEVTLTVTPDTGYQVKSVTLDGAAVTLTDGRYTFTITKNCTFSAEFEAVPENSFTVTVNSGEHGTVTPGTASYAEGTEVTLTVTPDTGYQVKSVTLDGAAVTLTDGRYTFTITKNCTFSAEFEAVSENSFTVTVNSGEHGTVTPGTASYVEGTEVTLTVSPDAGYQVKSVTLDGAAVTLTDGKYTFTVTKNCTFSAEFEAVSENSFTVTVKCGSHGTVTPGTASYAEGTEVTLTVTPDLGYKVSSVTLDGRALPLTYGSYTFTVTKNCTFSAEFTRKSSGGSSKPSDPDDNTSRLMVNGSPMTWDDIAKYLRSLPNGSSVSISLNGETEVPSMIVGIIKDKSHIVEFIADSTRSWVMTGTDISAVSSADLQTLPGKTDKSALRGVVGADLKVSGTIAPAALKLKFRTEFSGQFANIYKLTDGSLVYAGSAVIRADGSVVIPGADESGVYVVMVCEFSDLPGDADNDGAFSALDASEILKSAAGGSDVRNPLMSDLNGDGTVNALDASVILRRIVNS